MENLDPDDTTLTELPRDEVLQLLAELNSTYGRRILRASELLTERQRHAIAYGHPLAYGCCKPEPDAD